MRLLLPPSEAKRPGGDGPPLSAAAPGPLSRPRAQVQAAVNKLLRGSKAKAAEALLLPPAAKDDALAANHLAARSATLPALERYDGVLYRALDTPTLGPSARRRAQEAVIIFSGLLGMVEGGEPVPDYRVPAAAMLPGLGGAGRWWRSRLTPLLDEIAETDLVIDLRSTDYLQMWTAPANVVAIRVLTERGGKRVPVSYTAKHGKGLLARALLTRPARTPADVATVAESLGYAVEERSAGLDLITTWSPVTR